MATLTNTKIKDTYPGLLKITDNGVVEATEQVVTDGLGNNTTLSIGTASASVAGTLSFGSLKDTGENITITKFVDEADGISANDNDTSIPTSAAVKNYVDNAIPTEADTLATVTARGNTSNVDVIINSLTIGRGEGNDITNIAFGNNVLASNTTGDKNSGIGALSLSNVSTGSENTGIGYNSLVNTNGSNNTGIGVNSLRQTSTGVNNTGIGHGAGGTNQTGSNNVYIGYDADASGGFGVSNEIVIGASTTGNGSNTATYGNASIVEHHFTAGDVYMNADLFGLEVIGNAFGPTEYIRLTGGQLNFGTNGGDKVTIDSSGNVGMNAVPENSSGTWRNFNFGSLSMAGRSSNATPDAIFGTNFKFTTSNSEQRISAHPTSRLFFNDDVITFENAGADSAGSNITWSERMRIDSSGTTTMIKSSAGSSTTPLVVRNSGSTSVNTESKIFLSTVSGDDRGAYISAKITDASNGNALILATNTAGSSPSERMRITSSGNVGIGTSSPQQILSIQNTASNAYLHCVSGTSNLGGVWVGDSDSNYVGGFLYDNGINSSLFYTSGSERMRITSGGDVLIGKTGLSAGFVGFEVEPNGTARITKSSDFPLLLNRLTTEGAIVSIRYNSSPVGSISVTSSSTAYNTSSDYRLKENVVPMEGALDRVDALKPSRFNFIADPSTTVDGFIAHEVADVIPEAITGEKDAVDEEGNPIYQGIDQSKIVPLLVGAIKELRAEIESLKSQLS